MSVKRALVCGAGGFIGGHLVRRLKSEGYEVLGVDLKRHEYRETAADEFWVEDLRDPDVCRRAVAGQDEVYQLAADMGGAGYVFTGENDADVMHNSALVNLNIAEAATHEDGIRVFYSSSACIYPERNQMDPDDPRCHEDSAYPAAPDSEYGWEKLFSERLYAAFRRNRGLDVRMARFHNIFGPEGAWGNGREKAPAALCRKVAEADDGGTIEIWGDGKQTRSFLYVDECVEAVRRLMASDVLEPINIGSEEMITINDFAQLIAEVAGKSISLDHIEGPTGVRGRNSDNRMIRDKLGWAPSQPLRAGIEQTYRWVEAQVASAVTSRGAAAE